MAKEVNVRNFEEEVLKSDLPVLVDFWAPWCAPCRMVAPVLEEISKEYEGKLKICKVNVDESPELASQYGIMSIPTLLIFKGGIIVEQAIGAMPKQDLERLVSPYIEG
jgi:thioredoxin 1